MSESTEDFKVVEELRPNLRAINIKVRCSSKNEEREVTSRKSGETHRVTEALVGDESASILLTLWNDDIEKVEVDHNYQLNNVYTTIFRGSLRLNIGKYGSMEEIDEEDLKEVNIDNNLSDKQYPQQQRYRRSSRGSRFYQNKGGRYKRKPYKKGPYNRRM